MDRDLIEDLRENSRTYVRELGFFRKNIEAHGLTLAQGHILLEIDKSGEMTQEELAKCLNIDQSTASRNLKNLIRENYENEVRITKQVLRITEKGK